jgi:glycosyltransferase involved in cell wall biosynthesis
MTEKISVAMATYNGGQYIQHQLDSLARQTLPPYELVVTDDGSTDETLQILHDFAQRAHFPVRIYSNEATLGFSDNFLRAASLCQGEWIAFCDQDDVWMPAKLERIYQTIKRYKHDELVMVGHTSLLANEKLELTGQRLPDYSRNRLVKCGSNYGFFCIVGFSMACRATLISEFDSNLRPIKYRHAEWTPPGHDQWLGMLANAVGNIAYISEPLAIWRRHLSALTTPPKPQNIIQQALISGIALDAEPYILVGNMAHESANSLSNISKKITDKKIAQKLINAAEQFRKLAKNMNVRGDLYTRSRRMERLSVLARLFWENAYFGPTFSSLGWKSFIKDMAFAVGILRKYQIG